jgi:hypothetical protein
VLQLFTRRTGALLRWQRERGILRSIKDPKHGQFNLWEIAVLRQKLDEQFAKWFILSASRFLGKGV